MMLRIKDTTRKTITFVVGYGRSTKRLHFVPPGLFRRLLEAWLEDSQAGIDLTMVEMLFSRDYRLEVARDASLAAQAYAADRKMAEDYLASVAGRIYMTTMPLEADDEGHRPARALSPGIFFRLVKMTARERRITLQREHNSSDRSGRLPDLKGKVP